MAKFFKYEVTKKVTYRVNMNDLQKEYKDMIKHCGKDFDYTIYMKQLLKGNIKEDDLLDLMDWLEDETSVDVDVADCNLKFDRMYFSNKYHEDDEEDDE